MVAPTAQQSEESAQVTALRYCPSVLTDPGTGTMAQVEPFQCSTRAWPPAIWGKTPGMKLYWT